MAKKPQSTQQPSQRVGAEKNERLWDTPSRPITPTPDTALPSQPAAQPTPPAQPPAQPAQPTAEPASNPQSNTEKGS